MEIPDIINQGPCTLIPEIINQRKLFFLYVDRLRASAITKKANSGGKCLLCVFINSF